MNSILLTIIIVLLLIGVIAVAVVKGIARLMPWNGGMMQPPYYPQSGYSQPYGRRSDSGSGTGIIAVFLVVALIATLYTNPASDSSAVSIMEATLEKASTTQVQEQPTETVSSDDYETLANLGVFEPVRESSSAPTETPTPKEDIYSSGTQPVDDFYPRYAWQLGAYGSVTLANEYALEIMSKYPDVRVYDAGVGKEGRYKVVCSLSETRQPVLDWRKQHAGVKGFITQIN